jgi:hypothetical protein
MFLVVVLLLNVQCELQKKREKKAKLAEHQKNYQMFIDSTYPLSMGKEYLINGLTIRFDKKLIDNKYYHYVYYLSVRYEKEEPVYITTKPPWWGCGNPRSDLDFYMQKCISFHKVFGKEIGIITLDKSIHILKPEM